MQTRRESLINWTYVLPALLMMGLVNLLPVGSALWQASDFSRIPEDTRLWNSLRNTGVFTLATVSLELILGLAMAMILIKPFKGRGWVRAAVLIPWALPTAIMAMAWQWIYNSEYGVLGDLLFKSGLVSSPHIPWLASPGLAMAACILADVWKTTPFMALLLMSGLANIPKDLYEASSIDGAGPVKQFFIITLPLLKPTIALAVIFRAIQAFGIFDLIWVLTEGGPGGKTEMIALYVYRTAIRYHDIGYGCTLTLVMAGCLVLMSSLVFLVTRTEGQE